MRFSLKKIVAGAAVIGTVAAVAPFISTGVASAATNNGTPTLAPATGGPSTPYNLTLPLPGTCPGDALAGFAYQTFMVPAAVDVNTLTFTGSGPSWPNSGGNPNPVGAFKQPLFDSGLNPVVDQSPGLGSGVVSLPGLSFAALPLSGAGAPAPGAYKIGVGCTNSTPSPRTLQSYWFTVVTFSAGNNWAFGAAPIAPVVTGSAGNAAITYDIAPPVGAIPGATSYTVTIPGASGSPFTISGAAGFDPAPVTVSGLTNGTPYTVTATATNSAGTSPASTPLTLTPVLPPAPAVTGLNAVNGSGNVVFNWGTYVPPGGTTVSNIQVVIAGGTGAGTFLLAPGANTYTAAGNAGDAITATVTPIFSAPSGQIAPGASATGTVLASQVLNQVITVTRPNGALVLTQVCGRYGSLPADSTNPSLGAGGASLGFPNGIGAQTALAGGDDVTNPNVTTPGNGVAPSLTQGTVGFTGVGTIGPLPAVAASNFDPRTAAYPYPDDPTTGVANPTYPTWCGIELGAARFVSTGNPAFGQGQYYSAAGRLNQVTVVDTRDTDPGWNVAASLTDFTATGGKSFSANQMGWTPVKNRDTGLFLDALGNSYDQTATAGPTVLAGIPVPANGLGNGPANTLISAPARNVPGAVSSAGGGVYTGGLGIAVADARLRLAIPVTALSGNYTAVLTISSL